uniref:RRM domain-containing protein n=1 Tax=Plectus sambesii TaxID=2011161 RepID=A0A914V1F2_9BILA
MASGRSGYSLFVGNLPYQTTEDELGNFFSRAGNVVNIRIVSDRDTGRPKGFAFCEFDDEQGAQRAIDTLDGTEFNGRSIRVNWANSR